MDLPEENRLYAAHIAQLQRCYDSALAASGYDAVVIAAGTPYEVFLDDQHLPYKANPHLLQWGPLREHPGSVLVVRRDGDAELLVYSPPDFWYQIPPVPELIATGPLKHRLIAKPSEITSHVEKLRGTLAYIGDPIVDPQAFGIKAINPPELLEQLHDNRTRKTAWEVSNIRAASHSAIKGHLAAEASFLAGGSEYDIHLAFRSACCLTDDEMPYPAIVALNQNAATLHYQRLERATGMNLSLLIDAGSQCNGYASDVTRTYSDHAEFGALVEAMHELQRELCEAAQPGVDYKVLHQAAHLSIAGLLRESGIIHCSPEEAVSKGLSRVFFPHGLGHYLGLQVHDVGALYVPRSPGEKVPDGEDPRLRLTRILEPGNVLTIEPGLYFIESLLADLADSSLAKHVNWSTVAELKPYGGIRIEDNVHIGEHGNDNLTRQAFAAAS